MSCERACVMPEKESVYHMCQHEWLVTLRLFGQTRIVRGRTTYAMSRRPIRSASLSDCLELGSLENVKGRTKKGPWISRDASSRKRTERGGRETGQQG